MTHGRKLLLGIFAVAVLSFGLSVNANAQGGYYDPYNRRQDRRYNDNNYRRLRDAAQRIENRSEELEDRIDDALDNSRLDGTNREDNIIELADQFQQAAGRFENQIDNRRNGYGGENEARRLLQLGARLDQIISRGRFRDGRLQNVWAGIRNDLRIVANAYNSNYNDGGYGGRGRRRGY